MSYKVGADPEVFVEDTNGIIVPVIGFLGGTKEMPLPVENGALQEDNVMAEFNITPATNVDEFVNNIGSVMSQMNNRLGEHNLKYVVKASHQFSKKDLKHPQASRFGCDPDYNIYSMEQNKVISPEEIGNYRVAGGHIHMGFDDPDRHPLIRILAVRWMDILVGLPLAAIDDDTVRYKFYGKAGAYRVKPYGVEYRTASNYWLKSEALIRAVYKNTITAMKYAETLKTPEKHITDYNEARVIDAINNGLKERAEKLMRHYRVEFIT